MVNLFSKNLAFLAFILILAGTASAHWYCIQNTNNPADYFQRPAVAYSTSLSGGNIILNIEAKFCYSGNMNAIAVSSWGFGTKNTVCPNQQLGGSCGISMTSERGLCGLHYWKQTPSRFSIPPSGDYAPGNGNTVLTQLSDLRCESGKMWVVSRTLTLTQAEYNALSGDGKGFSMGLVSTDRSSTNYKTYPSEFIELEELKIECSTDSDCGTGAFLVNYCVGNDKWRNFGAPQCFNPASVSAYCGMADFIEFVESCSNGCSDGACLPAPLITCSVNSDCGVDVFTGNLFCSGNNVVQDYITHSCSNAGTSQSSCSSTTTAVLKQACTNGCADSACLPEPTPEQDITPPGSITGLHLVSKSTTTLQWAWANPIDSDFYQNIIYLNGAEVSRTANNYYYPTHLKSNTLYTIHVHTIDASGNINNADVSDAQRTKKVSSGGGSEKDKEDLIKKYYPLEDAVLSLPGMEEQEAGAINETKDITVKVSSSKSSGSWTWFFILLIMGVLLLVILVLILSAAKK